MNTLFDFDEIVADVPRGVRKRPYQVEAEEESFRLWDNGVRGSLVRLATGMGKTATASFIIRRWCERSSRHRAMVLAHEQQLVGQWPGEIEKFAGLVPLIEMGDQKVERNSMPSVVIASRASLLQRYSPREVNLMGHPSRVEVRWSRLEKFCPQEYHWLIVVDEAHRYALKLTSCGHIFEHFAANPESRVLGLTATPQRTDGTTLQKILPGVAIDYRMASGTPNAIDEGWAVPFRQYYVTCDNVDFTNLTVVRGDFHRAELGAVMAEQETLNRICQPMLDIVGERPTLIFNATIEAAEAVALWLNSKADRRVAASLNGNDKTWHRERTYKDFENGKLQFLSVAGLCREGYNNPNVGAIAIFRPTKSQSLAEQMKGRGCRPLRGLVDHLETAEERRTAIALSEKPDCLIVDVVGATSLEDVASTVDIYLDGEPDGIRLRAKKLLEDGEEQDPREAVERARSEEEEEQARLTAQKLAREAEARRQAEMDRRAALEAEVTYEATEVQQGHSLEQSRSASEAWAANETFRFGKHRGRKVGRVDSGYLQWIVGKMPRTKIGRAAAQELAARRKFSEMKMQVNRQRRKQPERVISVEDINAAFSEAMYDQD